MNPSKYKFECITPCFCAGENQGKAEIRPSSIRGELRWWFRALGGTREQESEVFGGVNPGRASSIQIRVSEVQPKAMGNLPTVQGVDPLSYILFFPSVSGSTKGARWNTSSCLGPGTTFDVHVRMLRRVSDKADIVWSRALIAFRHYGSIGMHVTRALGAIQDKAIDSESWAEADRILIEAGFLIRGADRREHDDWVGVVREAGAWLQGDLRKEFGAGGNKKPPTASALGSAQPVRQTSAVRLRPVKGMEGKLVFRAFEAPHIRVLGPESKRPHSQQILENRDFTQAPPASPQTFRR